jgi:hypothetical protein
VRRGAGSERGPWAGVGCGSGRKGPRADCWRPSQFSNFRDIRKNYLVSLGPTTKTQDLPGLRWRTGLNFERALLVNLMSAGSEVGTFISLRGRLCLGSRGVVDGPFRDPGK